jgi:ribosome-binding factor A
MLHRKERYEKQLQRVIYEIIQSDCKNDLLNDVSVSRVDLTSDLSLATVYYTIDKNVDSNEIKTIAKAFKEALPFIKRNIPLHITLRKIPDLKLKEDNSERNVKEIEEILKKLKNEPKSED